jgi:hypothetical protein
MADTIAADDHRHGWNADDPITDLITFLGYGGLWFFFTFLQMSSTQDAVFGLLQTGFVANPNETSQQIQAAMNGSLDREHLIAIGIALSVQASLMTLAFPVARSLLLAHKNSKLPSSSSTGAEALKLDKWKSTLVTLLVVGDVVTDFLYVLQGHNVFGGSVTLFLFSIPWFSSGMTIQAAAGILLVGIIYPAAIFVATVFFGNIAAKRLGSLIHRLKSSVIK